MPDRRSHRGPHPEDTKLFDASNHTTLRLAIEECAYLLSRGYAEASILQIVGNHHHLTQRQRMALRRSGCSDRSLERRRETCIPLTQCPNGQIGVDGYNLLITIESALSNGVILVGRDGCCRDLASVHGTYRKVSETLPAIRLIAKHFAEAGIRQVDWYLDRPVSNSGRLKAVMHDTLSETNIAWNIELADNPDHVLTKYEGPVASSDSWVLDRCDLWVNLATDIIKMHIPECWMVDMSPGSR